MKLLRMVKSTFVKSENNTVYFWDIKVDVPNRRVSTRAGRAGTLGVVSARVFDSYADTREAAETMMDRRVSDGWTQVA